MSSTEEPTQTGIDSGTEVIKTKPKRKCTEAQLQCLARNREKALEVIRTKGQKARLAKELKDRYKEHVTTEREAEIERLRTALAETNPKPQSKSKQRKRAPSPSESESESSPSPVPVKRKAKKTQAKRRPATPSDTSSSGSDCPQGNAARRAEEDPNEARLHDESRELRLQALHRQMFPFG